MGFEQLPAKLILQQHVNLNWFGENRKINPLTELNVIMERNDILHFYDAICLSGTCPEACS